jgi:predicted protein tyrosine phosphatase
MKKHRLNINKFPQVLIGSYVEADEYLLNQTQQSLIKYLISIGNPGDNPPSGFYEVPFRLRLEFHDLDKFDNDLDYILPTYEDIAKVICFINSISNWNGHLLIHCYMGISRSTAVAFIIWSYFLGSGKEEQALAYVLAARPKAHPNRLIVQLGDELLNRRGRLIQVFDSIFTNYI